MSESTVTPASKWRQSTNAEGHLVTLPSGNVARIKTPGIEVFLVSGMIPNSLLPIVQQAMEAGKAGKEVEADELSQSIFSDPKKMADLIELVDSVAVMSFVEPKVLPVPKEGEGRITEAEDVLYTDEISLEDRMFVFNYASGGTQSLERFRGELQAGVAHLSPGEDVELPAKPVAGNRAARRSTGSKKK